MITSPHLQPIRQAAEPCAKGAPTTTDRSVGALLNVCRKASGLLPQDFSRPRLFEENFQPVRIARLGEVDGLLTGYFEPIVQGSRFPTPEFHVPVYRRPRDLVVAGRKPGSNAFPNKGARIGRRNGKGQLVPYYDRGAIEAGALDGQKLEICWLKDPFDLLAIQIEGSGRVILEDGTPLRINYDLHNGYPLAHSAALSSNTIAFRAKKCLCNGFGAGWPRIRTKPPRCAAPIAPYVFFRVTGLSNDGRAGRRAGCAVDAGPVHCRRPAA